MLRIADWRRLKGTVAKSDCPRRQLCRQSLGPLQRPRQWTEDCWNQENVGNPGDGTARAHGDCGRWLKAMASGGRRVLRPIHACPRATCSPPPGAVRFRTPCGPASGAGSSGRSGSLPPGAGRSLRSPACCPLGPRPPSCRAGRPRPTPRRPRHWLARPG